MKKLILPVMALLCTCIASAQWNISIVGGFHQATVSPAFNQQPEATSVHQSPKTGLHFGFMANVPFSNRSRFYFQSGVIYSAKGATTAQLMDSTHPGLQSLSTTLNINYIDIPVHLLYKVPLSGKVKLVIGGGPQVSLFYNGNITTGSRDLSGNYSEATNNDLPVGNNSGQYKVVHFGANALAGFEAGRVSITANYSKDLTDFYQQNNISYKHQTIGITLGIGLCKMTPVDKPKVIINDDQNTNGDGIAHKDNSFPDIPASLHHHRLPVLDSDNTRVNDTDKDGVNDEADKCPALAGPKENAGCPLIVTTVALRVNTQAQPVRFKLNSATLTTSSFEVLDEVIRLVSKNPGLKITIEGHASGDGNPEKNKLLSQHRADAVKQYLISKGVSTKKITAIGYGSSRPLAAETKEAGKAKNRRVEIILND